MPKRVEEKTIEYNETLTHTGWSLSDIINYTEVASPETLSYKITAADDYNKTVSWTDMQSGILVDAGADGAMTFFPELSKKYWVKEVVSIELV